MQEKKAINIAVLDLRKLENSVCDYFIICEGNSNTHVSSISDSISKKTLTDLSNKVWHIEGKDKCEWVLLDYVNVVVHIFQKSFREFFSIEELWGDAKILKIKESNLNE
jgi:ribosome-associated protein